jgi:hypothetical protein
MRVMDHLGATIGDLAAALAAWLIPAGRIGWAVLALAVVALWVAWLCRGLTDWPRAITAGAPAASPTAWWPRARARALRLPLVAIAIAGLGARISPLLVLVQVAGLPSVDGSSDAWPLWALCLGWAALGLVQSAAAALAGVLTDRCVPALFLRIGWLCGAGVLAGLALADGPWLIAVGLAFGVLSGLTEGAEKTWIAALVPAGERATAFGAVALLSAGAGLAGNALCGLCIAHGWMVVFLALAACSALGAVLTLGRRG